MPKSFQRLGAEVGIGSTDTLFVVSGNAVMMVSLIVCNRGSSDRTFRAAHIDGAIGAFANEDYFAYIHPVSAKQSVIFQFGICLEDTHTLAVNGHADLTFQAYGFDVLLSNIKRLAAATALSGGDTIYTASSVITTVSAICICNRDSSAHTYDIAISDGGAVANEDYIAYEQVIAAYDTIPIQVGINLEDTHYIYAKSDSDLINVLAWGTERA